MTPISILCLAASKRQPPDSTFAVNGQKLFVSPSPSY